jgi:hypothetical protein
MSYSRLQAVCEGGSGEYAAVLVDRGDRPMELGTGRKVGKISGRNLVRG